MRHFTTIRTLRTLFLATMMMLAGGLCHAQYRAMLVSKDTDPGVRVKEYTRIQKDSIFRRASPHGIRYTRNHPLIVVADWAFPPFSYYNDRGEPDGMLIDILEQVFSHFHIAHEIRMMDRAEAHRQLASGQANLMIDVDNLPAMKGVTKGSSVVAGYEVSVLRLKDTDMMRSIMLLKKTDTVHVDKGSYSYYYLRDSFNDSIKFTLLSVDKRKVVDELMKGNIRYFIWEDAALRKMVSKYGIRDKMEIERIDVPEGRFRFFCTDSIIVHELDRTLQHMQATGRCAPILAKWLGDNPANPEKGGLQVTVFAILTVLFTIAVIVLLRTTMSGKLKSEFRTISRMGIEMSDSQMLAINVSHRWVHNLAGNFLPEGGVSMGEYVSMVHPDEIWIMRDVIAKVDVGETDMPVIHFRMRRHGDEEGVWRNMAVHARIKSKKGKPMYVYLTLIDESEYIHQRKLLDSVLEENSNFTKTSDFGIAFYDHNGRIVNYNEGFAKIFGKGRDMNVPEFLRTTKLHELCIYLNGFILEEDVDAWFCAPLDVPELNMKEIVELRLRTVRDDKRNHQGYALTIYDLEDAWTLRRNMQDIDREVAETKRKLEEYQKELRFIMKHNRMETFKWYAGNDYFDLSSDGVLFSRRKPVKEYAGSLADEDRDSLLREMNAPVEHYASPQRYTRHIKAVRGVTEERYMEISRMPIYDDCGNVAGVFGILYDVTDLVTTREKLDRQTAKANDSGRQKAQFLANMTHELRTPLNAINGFAEIMSFLTTSEEKKQYVDIMAFNCTMLINLIDNILQLTKIDTEGITIRRMETDFAKAFRKKAEDLRKYVNNPEVQYRIDSPRSSLTVKVDAERILQIFEAFVNNASKFTKKGFIHVGYRYTNDQLTVYCRDTGCGIPLEKQPAVFERFSKLDEFVQGTGLGLALCKAIADRMGATIDLYSNENEGTVISLNVDISNYSDLPDVQYFPPPPRSPNAPMTGR